jgi:hypothetical protein
MPEIEWALLVGGAKSLFAVGEILLPQELKNLD